jgi:protease-4
MIKFMQILKQYKYIIILGILVLGSAFYWFEYSPQQNRKNCSSVSIIYITGDIASSQRYNDDGSIYKGDTVALDVISQIRKAEKDKGVKAIVFAIDSSGGDAQSGIEISRAIKEIKKTTVALIRGQGQSAGYEIASTTGRIFALETSNIGAIGSTMSYVDNAKQNEANGLTFNQLSSGKYKDMGNTDKLLTYDERKIVMAMVNEFANIFIEEVAENRNLPIEKVRLLADGATLTASKALKEGLIDEIGSFADVDRYLSKILNRNIEMCIPVSKMEENKEYNDYDNTNAYCSEHEAGYSWAEKNFIDDPEKCEGNSQSFIEGCISYVEENK